MGGCSHLDYLDSSLQALSEGTEYKSWDLKWEIQDQYYQSYNLQVKL